MARMIASSFDLARCLFESSRDGLLQISAATGHISAANPTIERLTGLTRDHLLRLHVDDLLHRVDHEEDDENDGGAGASECHRLGRCEQPDLLVHVTRHRLSGDSDPTELIIVRENESLRPEDYAGWIDAVVVTDGGGAIQWANEAFLQFSGYSDVDLSGKPIEQVVHADSRQSVLGRLRQIHECGIEVTSEPELLNSDGETIAAEMWSRPVEYRGQPAAVSVFRDLTDQKRVEAFHSGQMRILEQLALGGQLVPVVERLIELIEQLFAGTRASVLLLDEDGVTLRHLAAPSLPDAYNTLIDGLQSGPAVGSCGTAVCRRERVVVFDTLTDPLWEPFRDLAEQFDHRACWSQPIVTADGDVLGTFAMYYRQPRGPSSLEIGLIENAAHVAGIAIQRFRSEQALRESQEEIARQRRELELILDAVQAQVVYMDTDARVVRHNRYSRDLLGLSDEDIRGLNVMSQSPHLDDPELRHQQSLEVIRTGQSRLGSIESYLEPDGRRWVSIDKVPTFDNDGQVNGLLLFIYDITQLKQAEQLVRESERRFQQLADNIDSAFWMSDESERRIVYVSPPYERIFGRSCEDVYQNPESFLGSVVPEDRERVRRKVERQANGESTIEEYRISRPDGSICWVRDQAFPICDESGAVVQVAGLAEDVTETKMAESRLREHEARLGRVARLSSLGEMAAGIVHELTQPLAAIRNFASVGDELTRNGNGSIDVDRLQNATQRIVEQSHRAGAIISRVRQLVTQSAPQRCELDLNDLIQNALRLIDTDLRNNSVQAETVISTHENRVRADAIQIEQVLINLLRNAVDALDENPREDRRLLIFSESREDEAIITIQDNGPGFGDTAPDQVFDMFYTTRAHGMGMGLSISRSIVRSHDGRMEAFEAPEGGAVIRMFLPRDESSTSLI